MTEEFERLIAALNNSLNNINSGIARNNQLFEKILEKQREREKSEDKPLADTVVVPANNEKEFDIMNPGYNRARVFIGALFTPAHSGGITVEMFYTNNKIGIGRVMKLICSNGASSQASEPIDIAHLTAFKFVVKNHDMSNDTTIRNFKIVMYNELITFNRLGDV